MPRAGNRAAAKMPSRVRFVSHPTRCGEIRNAQGPRLIKWTVNNAPRLPWVNSLTAPGRSETRNMVQRSSVRLPELEGRKSQRRVTKSVGRKRGSAESNGDEEQGAERPNGTRRAVGARGAYENGHAKRTDEMTDWDRISLSSRAELEQLVEVLKSVK